jgi:Tol biopolymer transport system component
VRSHISVIVLAAALASAPVAVPPVVAVPAPDTSADVAHVAEAAVPSANGRLLFRRTGDLYSVKATGTGQRRLTTTGDTEGGAQWSPDGTRIAFSRRGDIWVMSAGGGHARRVTTHPGPDVNPTWSRDGTRLAFQSRRGPHLLNDIYRLRSTVPYGRAVRLTDAEPTVPGSSACDWDEYEQPQWSPVGNRILLVHRCGHEYDFDDPSPEVVDATTGATVVDGLPALGNDPVWAPGGTRIAWTNDDYAFDFGNYCVSRVDLDGRNRVDVTPCGTESEALPDSRFPVWSPDGRKITFTQDGDAWVTRPDGATRSLLRQDAAPLSWKSR